jgi:hypothetical protein
MKKGTEQIKYSVIMKKGKEQIKEIQCNNEEGQRTNQRNTV